MPTEAPSASSASLAVTLASPVPSPQTSVPGSVVDVVVVEAPEHGVVAGIDAVAPALFCGSAGSAHAKSAALSPVSPMRRRPSEKM